MPIGTSIGTITRRPTYHPQDFLAPLPPKKPLPVSIDIVPPSARPEGEVEEEEKKGPLCPTGVTKEAQEQLLQVPIHHGLCSSPKRNTGAPNSIPVLFEREVVRRCRAIPSVYAVGPAGAARDNDTPKWGVEFDGFNPLNGTLYDGKASDNAKWTQKTVSDTFYMNSMRGTKFFMPSFTSIREIFPDIDIAFKNDLFFDFMKRTESFTSERVKAT